jgi:DNA-binding MltR family transcriptional regulator
MRSIGKTGLQKVMLLRRGAADRHQHRAVARAIGKSREQPEIRELLAMPASEDEKTVTTLDKAFDEFVSAVKLSSHLSHTAVVVTAAAILEDALEQCLKKKMRPLTKSMEIRLFQAYGPIGTLAAKIDLAYAFDITSEDINRELQLIRKIRNAFSHSKETLRLDKEPIRALFYSLKHPADATGTYPAQFMMCVQALANYLDAFLLRMSETRDSA